MKKVFVFLLYECVHLPYTFFTFFSFCYQSSFCNRVMVSCSIHGVDELYSCKESLRSSSFLVELSSPLWSSDCTNIAQFTDLKLLRYRQCDQILTREFSFQLSLGFSTLLRSQYWKYNIQIRCSRLFTVTSITVSK